MSPRRYYSDLPRASDLKHSPALAPGAMLVVLKLDWRRKDASISGAAVVFRSQRELSLGRRRWTIFSANFDFRDSTPSASNSAMRASCAGQHRHRQSLFSRAGWLTITKVNHCKNMKCSLTVKIYKNVTHPPLFLMYASYSGSTAPPGVSLDVWCVRGGSHVFTNLFDSE